MQHLVVQEVMQHCMRHAIAFRAEEYRSAGNTVRRCAKQRPKKIVKRNRMHFQVFKDQFPSFAPSQHNRNRHRAQYQGKPPSMHDLQGVRRKEGDINDQKESGSRPAQQQVVLPSVANDKKGQDSCRQHRCDNRDPICGRQVGRRAESHYCKNDDNQLQPVNERNVDLAYFTIRRMENAHARQKA